MRVEHRVASASHRITDLVKPKSVAPRNDTLPPALIDSFKLAHDGARRRCLSFAPILPISLKPKSVSSRNDTLPPRTLIDSSFPSVIASQRMTARVAVAYRKFLHANRDSPRKDYLPKTCPAASIRAGFYMQRRGLICCFQPTACIANLA